MTCNCNSSNFGKPREIDPIQNILNHKVDFDTVVNLGTYFSTLESLLTQYINAHYTFQCFADFGMGGMLFQRDTTLFINGLTNSINANYGVAALTYPTGGSVSFHMSNIEREITDWGSLTDLHTAFENANTAWKSLAPKTVNLPDQVNKMTLSVNDTRNLMIEIMVFSVNLEMLRSEYLTFMGRN